MDEKAMLCFDLKGIESMRKPEESKTLIISSFKPESPGEFARLQNFALCKKKKNPTNLKKDNDVVLI